MERFILDPKIRMQLPDVISRQVQLIFQTMLGVSVERADRVLGLSNDDDLISSVSLSQDQVKIVLRFGVPREFLSQLLCKVYGPVLGSHEVTFEDAVCEIANIVGNAVKKHLNENGFAFLMSIPKVGYDFQSRYDKGSDDHLELEFVLDSSRLSVDMITFFKSDILSNEVYL